MDDLKDRLGRLGRIVARESDRSADPATLPNARRRWLAAVVPEKKSRRAAIGLSFAFAACLAGALWLFVWSRRAPALSFTVGGPNAAGVVGQWVAPESTAPVDLRFEEGTVITLSPGARMRVTETHARGATLLIERGGVHAAITHRDADTRWSLQAGPFEVRVTGTAFDARWDPASETFELTMIEGTVVVSGPRLPQDRVVVAGEQLVVNATRMELRTGTAIVPSSAAPVLAAPAACVAASAAPPSASASAEVAKPVEASWKALARAGKYRDALVAAEAAGFSDEVARGSSSDLLALADAARFGGRPARAREALLAMRRRFGARGSSAFLLGKISADQLGSPGEAATWFETYLQEEPGGALAEQALGRVVEIRKRSDPGAARLAAERYLARYPGGAYAALARSLVVPR